jgi:hypothetical protein
MFHSKFSRGKWLNDRCEGIVSVVYLAIPGFSLKTETFKNGQLINSEK